MQQRVEINALFGINLAERGENRPDPVFIIGVLAYAVRVQVDGGKQRQVKLQSVPLGKTVSVCPQLLQAAVRHSDLGNPIIGNVENAKPRVELQPGKVCVGKLVVAEVELLQLLQLLEPVKMRQHVALAWR